VPAGRKTGRRPRHQDFKTPPDFSECYLSLNSFTSSTTADSLLQAHLRATSAGAQIKAFTRACKNQSLCKVINKKLEEKEIKNIILYHDKKKTNYC
jgi:hypothetical protein